MIVRHNAVLLHQQFLMFQGPNDCSTQCCAAAPTVLNVAKPLQSFDTFGPIHPATVPHPRGLVIICNTSV